MYFSKAVKKEKKENKRTMTLLQNHVTMCVEDTVLFTKLFPFIVLQVWGRIELLNPWLGVYVTLLANEL